MKTADEKDLPGHCSGASNKIMPRTDFDNRRKEKSTLFCLFRPKSETDNPVSMKSSDQELTERVKSLTDDEFQVYKWLRKHYSERWIAETLFVKKTQLRELEKTLFSKLSVPDAKGMFRIYGHLTTEEDES